MTTESDFDSVFDEIAEAVAHGAALLDEKAPGWANDISITDFDINDCDRCVLGQVGRKRFALKYSDSLRRLADVPLHGAWPEGKEDIDRAHGFEPMAWSPPLAKQDAAQAMANCWRKQIASRVTQGAQQ